MFDRRCNRPPATTAGRLHSGMAMEAAKRNTDKVRELARQASNRICFECEAHVRSVLPGLGQRRDLPDGGTCQNPVVSWRTAAEPDVRKPVQLYLCLRTMRRTFVRILAAWSRCSCRLS